MNVNTEKIAGRATLSSRGQITVPKQVRDALFLREGDTVSFSVERGAVVMTPARPDTDALDAWFGRFPLVTGPEGIVGWVRELRGWEPGEIDL